MRDLPRHHVAAYGVPSATTPQVQAASALVDAYLKRPEGLIWLPDYTGMPCYMAAPPPSFSLQSTGAIAPGQNVVVSLPANINLPKNFGEVVILDKGNAGAVEACSVVAVAKGSIMLASVANAHASACTIDFGLAIHEERALPSKRSITRVSRPQMVRLLSGSGRYAYGRRTDQQAGLYNDVNLLAIMETFGGPPDWIPFDVDQANFSPATSEIWVPAGVFLAYFSEVRIWYVAGFQASALPSIVKQATAAAVNAATNFPELTGSIKMVKAGDTAVERFGDSVLDADMKMQLAAYRANSFI